MSCIITYKGQKYSEEQFKEYFINNKQEFATSIAKNKDVIDSFKRKMEGIDFVFSQSPELASIGSKAQYLQYLSTIFKTSKVKNIVYHGSPKTKLEKIEGISFWTNERGNAYAYNIQRNEDNSEGFVTSAIVNIKNPYIHQEDINSRFATTTPKDLIIAAKSKNADGAIWRDVEDIGGRETQTVVFEPDQIHILGSKQDIDGFKEFVKSNNKLYNDNQVNYTLKAVDILLSDKAKQVFDKGEKNNWSLDKILTELQVPKEQKTLLLGLNIRDREQLALELASKYGYGVEINTATRGKQLGSHYVSDLSQDEFEDRIGWKVSHRITGEEIGVYDTETEAWEVANNSNNIIKENTQHYSNLSAPGGTNYTENEISTPLITPSIKGHAAFSTNSGIGWFRSDEKQNYTEQDIDTLINNMKNSGVLEINCS